MVHFKIKKSEVFCPKDLKMLLNYKLDMSILKGKT